MVTLPIFILILSILIIVHEFGHFFAARKLGVKVEKFSLGFGPQLLKKKKGATEYSVAAIPLGGFVKLAGDSLEEFKGSPDEYFSKPPGKRFWIIFSGALLNYILGFLFFWFIFFAGYPTLTAKVGGLMDGFGAKDAGLMVGDAIIEADGKKVVYWEDLQKIVQKKKGAEQAGLLVLRQGKEFRVRVDVKEKEFTDRLGKKHSVGLLGITPSEELIKTRHGFFESFSLGARKTWELTILTYQGLWSMITGKLSVRESVTGPLGIFFITSRAASMGIIALLHLMAVLNVSLAVFNLLPFPVLDGGHILFLGLEKLRRRPLGIKAEKAITQIGASILVTMVVFVTYNDIVRLFGEKIQKIFVK